MLPDFLIIGAQKAGTSWLAARLRQHPEVYLHPGEIHFFDKDFNYPRGLDWYESHFARAGGHAAIGEKTPDYLWANGRGGEGHLPDVHRNIHRHLPDAKLLISLRNPVERAVSATHHIIATGRIAPRHTIDDLLVGRQSHLLAEHGVLEYGDYWDQIESYLELFPKEQLLILIFEEDIIREPAGGLIRCCRYIGVDPGFSFTRLHRRENANTRSRLRLLADAYLPFPRAVTRPLDWILPPHRPRPRPSTLAALYERYAESNRKLFDFLGRETPASWTPR